MSGMLPVGRQQASGNGAETRSAAGVRSVDPAVPGSGFVVQPIRVHLSVLIVLLLIGIAAPLMWLTYHQGTSEAVESAQQQMRLLGRHVIDRYRSVFFDGLATARMAAATEVLSVPPPADIDGKTAFMRTAIENSPYMDTFFVGFPTGAFMQIVNMRSNEAWSRVLEAPPDAAYAIRTIERQGEEALSTWRFLGAAGEALGSRSTDEVNYDPRRRNWYRTALRNAGAVTVGPYVTATTQSLALTVAMPMQQNGRIITGIDMMLETISRLFAEQPISENARGYLFNRERKLIVHSDPAVMQATLQQLGGSGKAAANAPELDPVIEPIRELLRTAGPEQDGIVRFSVGGEPYLAQISSVGFSDLVRGNTIVIAAPLSDFTGPSVQNLKRTLAIAGILVMVGIVAALIAARLVSRALNALAGEARQIGNLDFARPDRSLSWIVEINMLSHALDASRDAISTFALYVPRELVRRIVNAGQAEADRGQRQEVTILFTDIKDFTTISEQQAPEEVVAMLSSYFEICNQTVEAHHGVIIQYLGDSIYAMWNAPTPDPSHADDACRCALALHQALDAFNDNQRRAGLPVLVTRFGLHTGEAVVGSVGAQARRQYTAMGDTVNVASRLEGMNKLFGTAVLASRALRDRATAGLFTFRPLGAAQAKGRAEEIEIFELAGLVDAPPAAGSS